MAIYLVSLFYGPKTMIFLVRQCTLEYR